MRVAYFDCFSGASGDMILGALLDAGVPLEALRGAVDRLGLGGYELARRDVARGGLRGTQALVTVDEGHHRQHGRRLDDILGIIGASDLDDGVKSSSEHVFRRLAAAESRVHGAPTDEVHFHEVGAMDAIVDVVGAVAGLAWLSVDRVVVSPLNVGSGTVECAHGPLPVPAPATAELIRGVPAYSAGVEGELLTPTGAAILTTLADAFGPLPAMVVDAVGYGAGGAERATPNLLRLMVGSAGEGEPDWVPDEVAVLETNIDDMSPQLYGHVIERALEAGALDAHVTSALMKKGRPGAVLSVICPTPLVAAMARLLFGETTTIGVRWRIDRRLTAHRRVEVVEGIAGPIAVKVATIGNDVVNMAPEYEECRTAALASGLPLKAVIEDARARALARFGGTPTPRERPEA